MKNRVDFLSEQRQQIDFMKEHEELKVMRDTQYFKDRCDKALLALKQSEKELGELRETRLYCDDIIEREEARKKAEVSETE